MLNIRVRITILACLLVIGGASRVDAQSGPVAAYGFNEGTGTTVADVTGNGRTGTVSGAVWNSSGRFGNSLTFDGVNDRVNIADHALLDLTTGMTLEAWVYPTALSNWRTVIMKERPSELSYSLYAHDGAPRPAAWITAGTSVSAQGASALPLNTWSHLAATYDGAMLRLYVDGVQVGTRAQTGSLFVSTSPLRIGGNAIWGEYFTGRIDEVRIYARALTPAQIAADMNTPVAPPVSDTTAPSVAITSPAQNASVSGVITVTASATDNVGVAGVQFFVDGTAIGAEDASNPYSITVDTFSLTNTAHQITTRARDAAGNTTTSAAVTINSFNMPRMTITAPAAGATISGSTVTVNYTLAGDLASVGVDHLHFQLDGGSELMDLSLDGVYQLQGVAPGSHTLNAWMVRGDHSKIAGTDAPGVLFSTTTPDTMPPTVALTSPAGSVSGIVQVAASASDDVGIAGVQFLLDGNALGAEDTSAPYSIDWTTNTVANGFHVLSARARDAAGNTTTSDGVTVDVANTEPPNLVAAYGFNEGTGTTTADASGNGLNGTLSATTWTTAGRFGSSLSFNGSSSLVTVADHALLDLTTGMTISAWVFPTTLSGYRTVVLKERPGDLAYSLYAHDGSPRPSTWITAGTTATAAGTSPLAANEWSHLAATYDGGALRLYVNGAQVGSITHTGSLFVSGSPLRIGGNTIWGEYFAGRLDEVRIYSRALSTAEIVTVMDLPIGGPPPTGSHSITGTISPATAGGGATISVTGTRTLTTVADANGNYTVAGLANGSYTLTPTKGGFTFTPANRTVTVSEGDVSAIDFTGSAAPTGIRLVQTTTVGVESNVSSISATFPQPNTAGNLLIVTGTSARPAGTITISDTAGNVYLPALGPVTEPNQDVTAYIWYVPNAKAGTNTVTLTPTAGVHAMEIHISEWSGAAASPLDQTAVGMGIGAFATTESRTTTVDGELIFGYAFVIHEATPGPGFTLLSYVNGDLDEYQIQTTAGSVAATFTQQSGEWLAMMATFKPLVTTPDTTAPTASITAPASGNVSGTITVSATAADNVGVAGVQFQLDGADLGIEDLSAPYSLSWNTATATPGPHVLTAIARDAAGNRTTSTAVNVTVVSGSDPSVVGQWGAPFELGVIAVNMVMLHTGSVLMFSGEFATTGPETVWNPSTGILTHVPVGRTNLFCAGHSQLADGRILVIGGHDPANGLLGSRDTNIFDPVTLTWTPAASMADARWYPTATTLPDGRVLALSGGTTCLTCIAEVPEVYNPLTNTWSRLTGARLSVPYYPFSYVLPDGRVLDAGANEQPVATRTLDIATQTWTTIDPVVVDGHTSAMYRPGRIIKSGTATDSGGSGPVAATAYVIDMNQPAPAWRQVASMAHPRAFHNMVLLPTGDVLVTGGGTRRDGYDGSFAIRDAELWSSVTETWRTLAPAQLPRLYHSTALLLPDARVLIAGGGNDGPAVNYTQGELYSPPYLFKGPRPTIASAPSQAQYGSTFVVETPDAAAITAVSLIRPGAVTHGFDEDQRFLNLAFTREAGRIVVSAPQNANLAPPGYYMLFVLAGEVPSRATFVRLPSPSEDTIPPTAPAGLSAIAGTGTVSLTWSASSDQTGVAVYNIHRATVPGVVATTANRIARTSATTYGDNVPGGSYYYVVTAEDVNGNVSGASNEANAVVASDGTPPAVNVTAPADGAQVSGLVNLTADASDNVGVAGVQFEVDSTPVGSEDVSAPYSFNWGSGGVSNGTHVITAVARDAQGNQTRSAPITVTVSNTQTPVGLVAAFGFDELSGTVATDASGNSNHGQISNAVRSAAGRYGRALSFNGANSMVSVADAPTHNRHDTVGLGPAVRADHVVDGDPERADRRARIRPLRERGHATAIGVAGKTRRYVGGRHVGRPAQYVDASCRDLQRHVARVVRQRRRSAAHRDVRLNHHVVGNAADRRQHNLE
jgi:hypothetical protein